MVYHIALLAGDGIGSEVTAVAAETVRAAASIYDFKVQIENALVGGAAYDATGNPLPAATLELCRRSDAVMLGAVGGPKWDRLEPASLRPEVGALLPLRKSLGLYANLRPARLFPSLASSSPLRYDLISKGMDILVVRELTGGIYFGTPKGRNVDDGSAVDTCVYNKKEIERIVRIGFESARGRGKRLCSVDKANVLETSRLWREVAIEIGKEYGDVELTHMLVDNCAMQLVRDPSQFDVIVTENMFGDILSDEAAMLTGSLGMLPSASIGDARTAGGAGVFGLYEPVHGSAPTIAGQDAANPLAAILSGSMLLRYSLGQPAAAEAIEKAVEETLAAGIRTADIAAKGEEIVGTAAMGFEVKKRIRRDGK